MNVYDLQLTAIRTVILVATILTPTVALACCPSDGKTSPSAARGLGESFPIAVNQSMDAAWQVYEFERDGIRYMQINDSTGDVRAAVGRIGETLWVLPIGRDADRVLMPGDALPTGSTRVVVRTNEVEIVLVENGAIQHWLVRALSSTR